MNEATGRAKVGSGMRRTARSRDGSAIVQRDVNVVGLWVRGKLSEWQAGKGTGIWEAGSRSRRRGRLL